MSSPIADLTYRSYDGPLNPPSARWWVITKMMTLKAFRNRFYWLFVALSGWYYLVILTVIFITELLAAQATEQLAGNGTAASQVADQIQFLDRLVWKLQYMHGFSYGQLIYMVIALLVGAGAVANDNRANALLVYLSKPCTRLDYVVGKFFGVWIPVFTAMAVPTTLFFLYGLLSYRNHGFTMYAWAYPAALGFMAMAATLHTSIMLGIGSLLKQGRIAGILYGTLYMITNIFTFMILIFFNISMGEARESARNAGQTFSAEAVKQHPALQTAFYSSIDGLNIGLAKAMLGVDGGNQFGLPITPGTFIPAPNGFVTFGMMAGISLIWLLIFWKRVRAVEVVN